MEAVANVEEWEIRPGGMLVQKRNSYSNQTCASSVPTIKVRVKYGSAYHEICISSRASFGELKKMLAEHTGLHPEEQKLIYKKKKRDSKVYLDVARVKDGSKIVLVQDITNTGKRCQDRLKIANIEKASQSLAQISLAVDKLAPQVTVLEASASKGEKVKDIELDNLTEKLMTELVKLDGIIAADQGDLKMQKRKQEKRIQNYVETLDRLKVRIRRTSSGQKPSQHQGQVQKQPELQQPPRHSESVVVVTTKWETFD